MSKKKNQIWIIDIAISRNSRIEDSEIKKNYQDLQVELGCLWKNISIVLIVIGTLGGVPRSLKKHFYIPGSEQIIPALQFPGTWLDLEFETITSPT